MGSNSSTFDNLNNQQTQSKPPNPDTKTEDNQNPDVKNANEQNPDGNFESVEKIEKGENEGQNGNLDGKEGEERGECGFCLFMKGGGCREEFIAWEDCIKDKDDEEDAAEKCSQVTENLFKCMFVHSDYYAPLIRKRDVDEKKVNDDGDGVEKVNGDGGEEKKEGSEMIIEEKIEVDVGKEVVEEKVEVGVGGNEGMKD